TGLPPINRTIVKEREFGSRDPNDGSLSGCVRSLAQNESDIAIAWTNYPSDDSVDKIYPFQIADESRITMISGYNVTHDFEVTDLINSFEMFDPGVWTSIFITLAVYAVLLKAFLTIHWRYRKVEIDKKRRQLRRPLVR